MSQEQLEENRPELEAGRQETPESQEESKILAITIYIEQPPYIDRLIEFLDTKAIAKKAEEYANRFRN